MTRFAERAMASKRKRTPRWHSFAWLLGSALAAALGGGSYAAHFLKPAYVPHNSYAQQDGMPETFHFGGRLWFIVADASDGWDGWLTDKKADAVTDCGHRVIVLRSTLPRAERVDSLFHEVLHVGACGTGTLDEEAQYYNSMTMHDHVGIERIALVYTSLFMENPELAAYMSGSQQ
jgi:hypothetical protein